MIIQGWKLWGNCGWYKGNPPAGFLFKFGEIVEDYPKGWSSIEILGIQIGKFVLSFGIWKA